MTCENEKECPLRILSLEDSPMDAELIKEYLLENFGSEIQINTVANEADFISAISKDKYDLILSDFRLPGFNGFQALEHAKSMISFTPFICVSGVIGEEAATELLKQGATDYVSKENLGRLKQSIERALKELKDQNDLKETNLSLIKSEERYKALTQTSFDGFLILDIEGRFLEVNDIYCKTSGCSREALLSMNIKDLELDEVDKQIDAHIQKIIDKGWDKFESRHRKSDGTFFNVDNSVTFIPNEKLFICFLHDITNRKKTEKDLLYMIYHDYLTELYNRRFFEEALKRIDTEENLPISIIMCDVNGLKLVNDSFGHTVGDDFLKKAAEIIKKACREDDIVARLGGDEFAVILQKTDSVETQQILDGIKNLASDVKIANVDLSISVGYDMKEKQDQSIAETLANAENNMYKHKLNERSSMRSKTIDLIMKTLFEKSNREMLHSKRVSGISEAIAMKMNYEKDEIGQIRIAGLVHDIGKIGIDEKILNKNGKPDNEEWKEIKKHPEMGWRILSSTNEFSEMANIVIAHHENWDGSGYPNGLKGEEIPLKARIIAVADTYDAMTRERSYRKALDKDEAIKELKKCSGTQFDPKIIDVFLNLVLPFNSTFALEGDSPIQNYKQELMPHN